MKLFDSQDIIRHLSVVEGEWVGFYRGHMLRSVFQPIYNKDLKAIYGFEALVRVSKNGQMVSPLQFLNSFYHETESINVCLVCAGLHLRNFGLLKSEAQLFVNINPSVFSRMSNNLGFVEVVKNRIAQEGLTSNQIVWEITEFKEKNTSKFISGIQLFRDCGHKIAIDDFGQLESNTKRVDLIHPDLVKIDRKLLLDFCLGVDKAFLPDLLAMLQDKGHKVVVEGIETPQEYDSLNSLPLDFVQGYLFGKPNDLNHWKSYFSNKTDCW